MTMTIISICSPSYDYLELADEANNVQLSCALTLSCKRTTITLYPIGRPVRATITLYPIGRPVRATITLYPIGRPVRATITLYPIGGLLELLLHCIL